MKKKKAHTRFDILDAHAERLAILKKHGKKHPSLTAFALSILYPKKKSNDH